MRGRSEVIQQVSAAGLLGLQRESGAKRNREPAGAELALQEVVKFLMM